MKKEMKKLALAVCAIALFACGANADEECTWSWWIGDAKASSNVDGCALGLGTERANVDGAQVSVCMNLANDVDGGAQVAFGYNRANKFEEGAQVSFFNRVKELRQGVQVGFCNIADSSSLQIGLLCFNKTGFLPVFVFFNFDKKMFRD
ncbi:MAG: hypothetical protein J6R18_10575 [Kiritimatiellae bacterium]|nr:hypothetical protein [Kiritimatiellia bacterium]